MYEQKSTKDSLGFFCGLRKKIGFTPPTRCQFHQHSTSSFFVQKSIEQLFCTYSLGLYFLPKGNWRKAAGKMLVKLTPGGAEICRSAAKMDFHGYFNQIWACKGASELAYLYCTYIFLGCFESFWISKCANKVENHWYIVQYSQRLYHHNAEVRILMA